MYRLITANRNYSSWSLRPWVLMRMLAIPFEDEQVAFDGLDNYDEFRRFAPNGMVPALVDGDRTIWDSLGISLYLGERHPMVWPDDESARSWARCVVCEMHSGFSALRNQCTMSVGVRAKLSAVSPPLQRDIARISEIFEEGRQRFGGSFLAGSEFTVADAFFAPVAFRIRTYDLSVGPRGREWVDRMLTLPAMVEWEKQALAEPYREVEHERELAENATIVADYRSPVAA